MNRIIYVLMMVMVAIAVNGCGKSEIKLAEEAYSETFESENDFPGTINVQILNGTSIGTLPDNPAKLQCPPASQFSAFAHNWSSPSTCDGYRDASSPLVQLSERQATSFISGISCPDGCERSQSIVWRGWACGHDGGKPKATHNSASGMAVSVVSCTPR